MKKTDRHSVIRGRRVSAIVLAGALVFGACASEEEATEDRAAAARLDQAQEVAIDTFVYRPASITVPVGTTVEWTNGDNILHTVTSGVQTDQGIPGVSKDKASKPDGTFDLQLDGEGTSASFTFDEAGTYRYFCSAHAAMTGRVVVE